MTAKQYSAQHGLSVNSLRWWASRFKRDGESGETAMRWAKIEVASEARPRPIMICVRDVRIAIERGFDGDTLEAIFAVIDRRPA